MIRINKLPLMALVMGTMLTAATVAWAEGETTTDTQSQTDMNTTIDSTADVNADTLPLDAAMLKEIDDDNVMHDGMTVGEIEGTDVYVGEDDIGEIETVLGDESGQVAAYILSVEDGVFDLSSTKLVVPVEEFTFDAENDRFKTQLTQADIETYQTWE
jgi:hypothetical protein